MARFLKQSTAFTFRIGPFVDSTDGASAETGLSIAQGDIQISKDGGAFAQTSASPTTTHDADGWYQCPLTATDTDTLGPLTVQVNVSGALPVWEHFMVVPANVYDSIVDGSDNLEVDSVAVSGDSTAADNLEADYDGTGYNKSNSTIGTTTTNTDMVSAAPTAAAVRAEIDSNSTQLAAILTDTGTTLDGKLDTIDGIVDQILVDTDTTIPGLIAALNDISAGDVTGSTMTELSSDPGASPTMAQAIALLYMAVRNKLDVTSSAKEIHNNAGSVVFTKALTDDGTTYSEGKMS